MGALLKQLEEVLREELEIYEDILALSKTKTGCLVEGNVKRLDNIVRSEQVLILKIGKLEEERFRILKEISKDIEIDVDRITLTDLLNKIDTDSEHHLKEIQQKITSVLSELEKVNQTNSRLIQKSLEHINHSIKLMTSALEEDTGIYRDGSGKKDKKDVKSFVDIKL